MKIKELLKLAYTRPDYWKLKKEIESKKYEKKIFLLGTPAHGNLGDHAIAVSAVSFLDKAFHKQPVFELSMPFCLSQERFLKQVISPEDILCISGGGWLGDLWKHNEIFVRNILSRYYRNKILILPQTVYYQDLNADFYKEAGSIYARPENLYFFLREKKSFDFVLSRHLYRHREHVFLAPDLALGLSYRKQFRRSHTVGVCFRNDVEKEITQKNCRLMKEYLMEQNFAIRETTTVYERYIRCSDRERVLNEKLDEFAQYKLVITDRLHAMLFCTITGTPCVVFNNKTKKISGVYDWIAPLSYIRLAFDEREGKACVDSLLTMDSAGLYDNRRMEASFAPLRNLLMQWNGEGKKDSF